MNVSFTTRLATWLCLWLSAPLAFGQQPDIVRFEQLGYGSRTITAVNNVSRYYVRVAPDLNLNASSVTLRVQASQELNANQSYLTVRLGGNNAFSSRLAALPNGTLTLPLNSRMLAKGSEYLELEVVTRLTISEQPCQDVDNPALWLTVLGDSQFTFAPGGPSSRLSAGLDRQRVIVYPAQPSLVDLRALSVVYTRLKNSSGQEPRLYSYAQKPDSVRHYVVVGALPQLPAAVRAQLKTPVSAGQGLLYRLRATPSDNVFVVTGRDEAGYRKATDALLDPNVVASAFGQYVVVNQSAPAPAVSAEAPGRLSLQELGGGPSLAQGIGSSRTLYGLNMSDLTRVPDQLNVRIKGSYSSLRGADKGFFNVYVNGTLVGSTQLSEVGKLDYSVAVDRKLIRKRNAIETEFWFRPGNDMCEGGLARFVGQVDVQNSYVESTGSATPKLLSFDYFPTAFRHAQTQVRLRPNVTPGLVRGLAEVIYKLNDRSNRPLFCPDILFTTSVAEARGPVVALVAPTDPYLSQLGTSPVQFNKPFRIYNNELNRMTYELADSVGCGIAQIFYGPGQRPVLAISARGGAGELALGNVVTNLDDPMAGVSNVQLATTELQHFFRISDYGNVFDDASADRMLWSRWSGWLFTLALLLVTAAFWFIRRKSRQSEQFLVESKQAQ